MTDNSLRVRVAAPAHESKANRELVRYLAQCLGVSATDVTILRGASGRNKVLEVRGVTHDEAMRRLLSQLEA